MESLARGKAGGVIVVRCASQYFETYPILIYLALEKTDPFIYLIVRNVDLFIYLLPSDFIPIYCWQLQKYSSQFISERKIYAYTGVSEKWGLSHTDQEKNRVTGFMEHTISLLSIDS